MTTSTKKWILIADDEPEVRELIDNYIEMHFGDTVNVVQANDGLEASHKIQFQAFDIIITDLKMPRKEGRAFIQTARESQLNNNTPIVVITGYPDSSLESENKYVTLIPKPFEMSALLKEVEKQFLLGNVDKRLGAAVLNAYIKGTFGFVTKVMNLEPEQEVATPKKPGPLNPDKEFVRITFKSGKSRCVFIVSFDKAVVRRISQCLNTDVALDSQLICVTAAKTIFRRASTLMWKESNTRPILIECFYISKNHQDAIRSLEKAKGITMPVKTEVGYVIVQALWEETYSFNLNELNKKSA